MNLCLFFTRMGYKSIASIPRHLLGNVVSYSTKLLSVHLQTQVKMETVRDLVCPVFKLVSLDSDPAVHLVSVVSDQYVLNYD